MHDHDSSSKNDGHKGMMWMMAICCGLPILFILASGASGKALGAPTWAVFGGIAVMLAVHFFAMGGSRKHADKSESALSEVDKKEKKGDTTSSDHGCCH